MDMKALHAGLFALMALASSCSISERDFVGGVTVAGHPYKTDPDCKRTVPYGKFDKECDYPVVGMRGFTAFPKITPTTGGGGGTPTH
jgi:hypothetical protein